MRGVLIGVVAVLAVGLAGCTSSDPKMVASAATSSEECLTSPGETVTVYLFEGSSSDRCVALGIHQKIEFFNKGFSSATVDWFGDRGLGSDESFTTGVVGDLLEVGLYQIAGKPFKVPNLFVVSPGPGLGADVHGALGMTVAEAEALLGEKLVMVDYVADPNACWTAVVANDPYSPIFIGAAKPGSAIEQIVVTYPRIENFGAENICHGRASSRLGVWVAIYDSEFAANRGPGVIQLSRS